MSVFGQQSSTNTEMATGLGQSDYSLTTNYQGKAPLNSTIASDTWLPGTAGVDCKLVHGDRWQEIEGNMLQHVAKEKISTYDGDFSEGYSGNVTRTMSGPSFEEAYNTPKKCDRDYMGHVDEYYHMGHTQKNDVEEIETRTLKAEVIQQYSTEVNPMKLELLGVAASYTWVLEASGASLGFCLRGAELGLAGVKGEFGLRKWEKSLFKDEIEALKGEIQASKLGLSSFACMLRSTQVHLGELLATGFVAPG